MSDIGRFAGRDPFSGRNLETEVRADCGATSPDMGQPKQNDATCTTPDTALAQRFADAVQMANLDADVADLFDASQETIGDALQKVQDDSTNLIAGQELLALSTVPSSYASAFTLLAAQEAPATARGDVMADRIGWLVENAIRADLASLQGRPVEVALKLAGAVPGLEGVTVSMTAGALDVVLQRSAAIEATANLRAAATGLADSLRQRFGKRIVRIYNRGPALPTIPEADSPSEET